MIPAPQKLPSLSLPNQDGIPTNPAESIGKFVVIYFYPKAQTSGCTQQACLMRDILPSWPQGDVDVFAVSPDPIKLLKKFKEEHNLNFNLLSDSDKKLANIFSSWVKKSMYGREYMGMSRDSFLYSPHGELIATFRKVKPSEHAKLINDSISTYKSIHI